MIMTDVVISAISGRVLHLFRKRETYYEYERNQFAR